MFKVTFLPHQRSIRVPAGTTVIRAAMDAGVHINASCGGDGVCGKCRILLEEGSVSGGDSERLREEDRARGYRLACQAQVESDLVVRVPVESTVNADNYQYLFTKAQRMHHLLDLEAPSLPSDSRKNGSH